MPFQSVSRRVFPIAVAFALVACSTSDDAEDTAADSPQPMDSLVTVEWLQENFNDPSLIILDCTVEVRQDEDGSIGTFSGLEGFKAGHIPGAGFADLKGDLVDTDSPLGFAVPLPQVFAAAMGKLGVGDDSRVVLYDRMNSAWAARIWWMLRWIGFDNAAILDGGFNAWTSAGLPQSTEVTHRKNRTLSIRERPELIADRDEVFASIDDDAVSLIDALSAAHFRGDWGIYERKGHIPSASNIPMTSMMGEDGKFLPQEELQALFEGVDDGRTITYCGGGIAASATAFVLTRLGYDDVAVYTASLQEWSANPDNPLQVVSAEDAAQE